MKKEVINQIFRAKYSLGGFFEMRPIRFLHGHLVALFLRATSVSVRLKHTGDFFVASNIKIYEVLFRFFS